MKHPSPIELSRALIEGVGDRLRAHLDICDRCNEELAAHASVAEDVRQLPVVDPDEDRARVLRASLFAAARTASPAPRRGFLLGFALAGGLAVAAVAAFVLMRPSDPAHVARIKAHDGAELVHIEKPDEIVRLSDGSVTIQVAALDKAERFRVVTGDAEIESRGASFDVRVTRDRLQSVRVYDGQVEVRAEGSPPRTVTAGERWEIQIAHTSATPREASAGDPSSPPTPVIDPSSAGEVPNRAASVAEKRTTPRVEVPRARAIDKQPDRTAPVEPPPSNLRAQDKPSIAKPSRAKRPIEVLFDQGWAALTAGDPAAAAQIFERAARAAPDDPLAEDASFWRASALVRAKSAAASSALDSFLSRYPKSPRVGEASAMFGWIVIDRDLDRAEKLFQTAAADRVASVRASGAKGLAAVAARRAK